jgi:uncharacterized hydrophobic protein (TIGR00271 family)
MPILLFKNISAEHKSETIERLITHSTPSQDFFLMIILATAMAAIGLLLNSAAIVIGSMLISPMLYSFLSLSLGLSISDHKLIFQSFLSIVKSLIIGIAAATIITLFFPPAGLTSEILSRINPTLAYGTIALIAGFAAAFAMVKPQLNETLPGIAIAVALIPPIAVVGIGVATLNWAVIRGSLLLFLLNAVAIIIGSIIVFSLANFHVKKHLAEEILEEEEKKLEKEKEESEEQEKI